MTAQLTTEINELRNQVRTLKRMLFGVFGLVVVSGLLAATSLQSVPDVIKARSFEVVNKDGNLVAGLSVDPDGNGALAILSKDMQPTCAIVSASPYGGMLSLANMDGEQKVLITSTGSAGTLHLYNNAGNKALHAGVNLGGNGHVTTHSSGGIATTRLGGNVISGVGELEIYNKGETRVVRIFADRGEVDVSLKEGKADIGFGSDGDGAMEIQNAKGEVVFEAP